MGLRLSPCRHVRQPQRWIIVTVGRPLLLSQQQHPGGGLIRANRPTISSTDRRNLASGRIPCTSSPDRQKQRVCIGKQRRRRGLRGVCCSSCPYRWAPWVRCQGQACRRPPTKKGRKARRPLGSGPVLRLERDGQRGRSDNDKR